MSKINWPSENYFVTPEDTRGAAKCGISLGLELGFLSFFSPRSCSWRTNQIRSEIIPQDPCNIPVETWRASLVPSRESTVTSGSAFHFYPTIRSH